MIALLQCVQFAKIEVNNNLIGQIERGLLVFLGVEKNDQQIQADKLLQRVLEYRIFPDENGKMNKNVKDIQGGLLIVPQFTLAADTQNGLRPTFTPAAEPQLGEQLFNYFVMQVRAIYSPVATGKFGAMMQVTLCNDGPATFWLQVT